MPARVAGVRMVEIDGLPVAAIDYVVKGEKATLYVSPSGQSMLVDAGYAGFANREQT